MGLTKADLVLELQKTGSYLYANGLTWGNAGNLSARLGEDRALVTASGTNLGELGSDDFVEVAVTGSSKETYSRKPTKELPMHRAIYAVRPEIQAVVHASPFYTTLIACSGVDIPASWFVESMYYLERVARVPYAHPGSARLGELVGEQAGKANLLLLENHGVLAYDTSLKEALMGLHTYELAAKMYLEARSAGIEMKELPPDVVQDFLTNSGYRAPREWKE
jgi:3-dehydro-4-phosphotetronate decarboxylase